MPIINVIDKSFEICSLNNLLMKNQNEKHLVLKNNCESSLNKYILVSCTTDTSDVMK